MKPNLICYVLLKNGRMIECSSEQKENLMMVLLMAESMEKRVKLGGEIFRLNEIESDPEKVLQSKQVSLPLDDKQKDTKYNNLA